MKKSDTTTKAANGADGKFCAHTLIASEKFFTRGFVAYDTGEKSRATNLSVQGRSGKFCANEQNEQSGYFKEKNLAVFDQTRRWPDLYLADAAGFYARSKSRGFGV